MRVIAGEAKGRKLKGPAGPWTRPMADKIKEALFSVFASLGVVPDRVLDLYAGTGGIGIEALSRGAEWADFVEQNGAACAVIRTNLALAGYVARGSVHQTSVTSFLVRANAAAEPYDLVILDPPYADPDIIETADKVGRSSLVQSGSVVAIGHWPRIDLPERIGRLNLLRSRCHGDSCFSIYDVDETDGPIESANE